MEVDGIKLGKRLGKNNYIDAQLWNLCWGMGLGMMSFMTSPPEVHNGDECWSMRE